MTLKQFRISTALDMAIVQRCSPDILSFEEASEISYGSSSLGDYQAPWVSYQGEYYHGRAAQEILDQYKRDVVEPTIARAKDDSRYIID